MSWVLFPITPPKWFPPVGSPPDWPLPSTPPTLLDYGLQVHLQTHLYKPSKFEQPSPATASPHILDHSIYICTIMGFKRSSVLTPSWPPSATPNLLNHNFQALLKTCSVVASDCISNSTWSPSPGTPQITLNISKMYIGLETSCKPRRYSCWLHQWF